MAQQIPDALKNVLKAEGVDPDHLEKMIIKVVDVLAEQVRNKEVFHSSDVLKKISDACPDMTVMEALFLGGFVHDHLRKNSHFIPKFDA